MSLRALFYCRNISTAQRCELALTLKSVIQARAREKEQERKTTYPKSDKSNLQPINTLKELAKTAGVGHNTIFQYETVRNEAPEEIKL